MLVSCYYVLVSLHQFIRNNVKVLSLLLNHHSHIVHDFVNSVGGLLHLANHLVLLQHYLALDLVVDLYLLLCDQRGLLIAFFLSIEVVVIHRSPFYVFLGILALGIGPTSRPANK